jgi:phospholipase/carboxylesterase
MGWQKSEYGWRLVPASGPARSLVILLHGVGSNARDLVPLADAWADALPSTAFASLDGTEPFDGGFDGRQWFSLRDITPENREERATLAYQAFKVVLDAELAYWGLDSSRLALVGFSQGSMMALHHLATDPVGMLAVVAYSGRLVSPIVAHSASPLALIHGEDDTVVDASELSLAAAAFEAAGYPVEAYLLPGVEHTISEEGSVLGLASLRRRLNI